MSRAWMPLYVADYLGDTSHLTTVEHGAYMLLIMSYWQRSGLPDDDNKLARICRLTADEWGDIRGTIAELFGPNWTHKRIDAELAKSEEIISKRQAAGKAGAEARYGKRMANAKQVPKQTHSQSQSQSQSQLSSDEDNRRASPRDELLTVLDAEHAEAVIAHRKALRKPLTQRAAKMLAGNFSQTSDPNAAADLMIARGWQGFEPDWMHNERTHDDGRQRGGLDATLTALGKVTEQRIAERERQMGSQGTDTRTAPAGSGEPEIVPFRPPQRFAG